MGKGIKVPGIGRLGVITPQFYREKAGYGSGQKRVVGASDFSTNLGVRVLRDAEYTIDGKRVHSTELRDYSPEEQARKVYIEGTGYYVEAKEVMSFWGRFWGNIRGNDTVIDLGSGLVTNVGVLALANDSNWSATNALNSLFAKLKYHATGTGSTADAATDIKLQTASTQGGQTPVAGTQVLVSAANLQKWQSVATINYTGTEAVTEWALFAYGSSLPTSSNLSSATGSPFTAGSATTGTVTGTPLTASSGTVMGQQLSIIENTGNATPSWGLITGNTTSVVTVPAWYKVSDGTAGANPANTDTYVLRPIMWDHKKFSAINVNNGDSIQFTYTLTNNSGG